eukprot:PhM_4_TR14153/c0_g1_i1/m.51553
MGNSCCSKSARITSSASSDDEFNAAYQNTNSHNNNISAQDVADTRNFVLNPPTLSHVSSTSDMSSVGIPRGLSMGSQLPSARGIGAGGSPLSPNNNNNNNNYTNTPTNAIRTAAMLEGVPQVSSPTSSSSAAAAAAASGADVTSKVKTVASVTVNQDEISGKTSINEFTLLRLLGEGSYGHVYLASREGSEAESDLVAIKAIPRDKLNNLAEITLLRTISHASIIQLVQVIDDAAHDTLYIVMEYMDGGVIMTLNNDGEALETPFTEAEVRPLFAQLVHALAYLHRENVFHGDVKPGNIFVDRERRVAKLGDFGAARLFKNKQKGDLIRGFQGTLAFMPPEMSVGGDVHFNGFACDVWALGVTLYCLVFGHTPFHGSNLKRMYNESLEVPIEYPNEDGALSGQIINMMQRMLCRDLLARITVSELRDHPWLTESSAPVNPRNLVASRSWRTIRREHQGTASSSQVGEPTSVTTNTATNNLDGTNHRILLVEDVVTQRQILRRFFDSAVDKENVEIDVVGDGQDAIVSVTQKAFRLILMDVHMYVMNGFEATMLIREYERQTKIENPAIIVGLSADPHEDLANYCRDVGMNDVVPKPITLRQVKDLCAAYGFPVVGKGVRKQLAEQKNKSSEPTTVSAYSRAYDNYLLKTGDPDAATTSSSSSLTMASSPVQQPVAAVMTNVPGSPVLSAAAAPGTGLNDIELGDAMSCPTSGIARMLMMVERRERRLELRRAPAVGAGLIIALAALYRHFSELIGNETLSASTMPSGSSFVTEDSATVSPLLAQNVTLQSAGRTSPTSPPPILMVPSSTSVLTTVATGTTVATSTSESDTSGGNATNLSNKTSFRTSGLRARHLPEVHLSKSGGVSERRKEEEIMLQLEEAERSRKMDMRKFFEFQLRRAAQLQDQFMEGLEGNSPRHGSVSTRASSHRGSLMSLADPSTASDAEDIRQRGIRAMFKAHKTYNASYTNDFDLNEFVWESDLTAVITSMAWRLYVSALRGNLQLRHRDDYKPLRDCCLRIVRTWQRHPDTKYPLRRPGVEDSVRNNSALTSFLESIERRRRASAQSSDTMIIGPSDPTSPHVIVVKEDRNRRSTMEDYTQVIISEDEITFGIYDGHGGDQSARYAKEVLLWHCIQKDDIAAWPDVFEQVNAVLLQKAREADCDAGTTALVVRLRGATLELANLGDCSAVLYTRGVGAQQLHNIHTTDQEEERKAVEARGGLVLFNNGKLRVNGMLLVTRALGDTPCEDVMTARPDIVTRELDPVLDEFILAASDGLWNFMSVEEACTIVNDMFDVIDKAAQAKKNGAAGQQQQQDMNNMSKSDDISMFMTCTEKDVADALVFEVKERGGSDNISIVLVRLWKREYAPPELTTTLVSNV